jgi:hypothetical protein
MQHLEVRGSVVLYIGRTVSKWLRLDWQSHIFQVRSAARVQVCQGQWPDVSLRSTRQMCLKQHFVLFGSLCIFAVAIGDWQTLWVCRVLSELKWIPSNCLLLKQFLTTCGLVHCSLVEIWTVGSYTKLSNHSKSGPVIFTKLLASFLFHIHWRTERMQSLLISHSLFLSIVFARFFICVCMCVCERERAREICVLAPGHLIGLFP